MLDDNKELVESWTHTVYSSAAAPYVAGAGLHWYTVGRSYIPYSAEAEEGTHTQTHRHIHTERQRERERERERERCLRDSLFMLVLCWCWNRATTSTQCPE